MKGVLRCPKFFELWSTNGLKRDRTLPTLIILFRPSPSHTLYAALTWRPTTPLNETALNLSAAQIRGATRC